MFKRSDLFQGPSGYPAVSFRECAMFCTGLFIFKGNYGNKLQWSYICILKHPFLFGGYNYVSKKKHIFSQQLNKHHTPHATHSSVIANYFYKTKFFQKNWGELGSYPTKTWQPLGPMLRGERSGIRRSPVRCAKKKQDFLWDKVQKAWWDHDQIHAYMFLFSTQTSCTIIFGKFLKLIIHFASSLIPLHIGTIFHC